MTPLEHALDLASRGFYVFPINPDTRHPIHKGWQQEATRDPETIKKLWRRAHGVAISTTNYADDSHLCVVDVDVKHGKRGDESLLALELDGCEFPPTLSHATPSGGTHLFYLADKPLRCTVEELARGIDTRGDGGYVVAPGTDGYRQINCLSTLAPVPGWLAVRLGARRVRSRVPGDALDGVDRDRARDRAVALLKAAEPAVEGEGGDLATFRLACRVKDAGVALEDAIMLMDEYWNERCSPPWDFADLGRKVENAYRYGFEPVGAAAPEAAFPAIQEPEADEPGHPLAAINKEYAFVRKGAVIIQETTDHKGRACLERMTPADMHAWFANQTMSTGKEKPRPLSMHWMEWTKRRQYDGVVLAPCQKVGERWYNLWRGFTVEPAADPRHPAVDLFLEHAHKNICRGDDTVYRWLMGWFAHLVQRPWEKPLVAVVFKGRKGTGKSALIERVGALLGKHFLVADDDRYLVSNFNAHLENCLLFVLEEATWAGDKKAEGKLKNLITGSQHVIEFKNREPHQVDNLLRVAIIGNESWIVPATQDERRFAVFEVGEGRMQDRAFFVAMREGMEQGGYAHLLRYFLDFDLSKVDVNAAPNTHGLIDQKLQGLKPLPAWWFDCVWTGRILGADFGDDWPEAINTTRMREAYLKHRRATGTIKHAENDKEFGRALMAMCPSLGKKKVRPEQAGDTTYAYVFSSLERMREDFERFIGGAIQWN